MLAPRDGWACACRHGTGPSLSTGSPMTLSTRPSVPRPTGTVMGPPRSRAFMPRTIPSVGSMATQRTRPSPSCCSTSRMTLMGCGTLKPVTGDAQRRINGRQRLFGELHVHRGTRDLNNVSDIFCHMKPSSSAVSFQPSASFSLSAFSCQPLAVNSCCRTHRDRKWISSDHRISRLP